MVELCGKPLLYYTLKAALNSNLDRVVVSTDCDMISKIALKFGCEVINRPAHLAEDNTPTLPVLQHAIEHQATAFDYIVTLQPTSPLRSSNHINESIKLITEDECADSLVSIVPVPHNMVPESIMKMESGYLIPYMDSEINRRQEKPSYYARNGAAIYISHSSILNQGILGKKILPYKMDEDFSIDIDSIEDLNKAEFFIGKN